MTTILFKKKKNNIEVKNLLSTYKIEIEENRNLRFLARKTQHTASQCRMCPIEYQTLCTLNK